MTELWIKLLEWFKNLPYVANISEDLFSRGLGAGFVIGMAACILLLILLRMMFHDRGSGMIRVQSGTGVISVSVNAIGSVIRHAAEKSIKCLDIQRVRIYKKSGGYQVLIRARMDASKETAPQLMDKLSVIVREQMSAAFGIDNVADVKLIIASCRGNADIPVEGTAAAPHDGSQEENREEDRTNKSHSPFIRLNNSHKDEEF